MKLHRQKIIEFLINYVEKITFEKKFQKKLKKIPELQNKSLIILDVGANIGQSYKMYQKIFQIKKYFALEPNLCSYNILKQQLPLVKSFNVAAGNKSTLVDFYISPISILSTTLLPNLDSKWFTLKKIIMGNSLTKFQKATVKQVTIDDFVTEQNIAQIDLLKVDVEGFELQVLVGSQNALRNGIISVIQLEQHFNDQRENNYEEIKLILSKFKFEEKIVMKHLIGNFSEIIFTHQSPINLA